MAKVDVGLHGKPIEHDELLDGAYESPDEYADQGDTRVVRDLSFAHLVVTGEDGAGNEILHPVDSPRGTELTIEQMGLKALRFGEQNHSFYTTKELEAIRNPRAAAAATTTVSVSEMGEYELAEWLNQPGESGGSKKTINEVLEAIGDDKDLAHRMLQAENIATDGDPRKGLEEGLTRIIEDS